MIDLIHDRYQVQQVLGQKRGRRTYLAWDPDTQQHVVIKVLSFADDLAWDDLKLFEREIQILPQLTHPGIPRYLDSFDLVGTSPGTCQKALVQTYLEAPSLQTLLSQGQRFSEAQLRQIAQEVLEILAYLHSQIPPVIHRDLKPSNILWSDTQQVFLVDFGAVQLTSHREGSTFTVVGTYGYMPPEQFGGRTVPASDLYSLGATLVTLMTGIPPADLPQKDLRPAFESVVTVSPALVRWLQCLLDPRLEQRFSSAAVALVALEACSTKLTPVPRAALAPPPGSRIRVGRLDQTLEIVIPGAGWSWPVVVMGGVALAWDLLIILSLGRVLLAAPFLIKLILGVFALPFGLVGIRLTLPVFFTLWGRLRFRITPQVLDRTIELWGFRLHHPKPCPLQQITKLEILSTLTAQEHPVQGIPLPGLDWQAGAIQLRLWAGAQSYIINHLSSDEAEWLGSLLSETLGIPLQTPEEIE